MATDKVELRGPCPADLAQALDALAHADGVDRNHYVNTVLEKHVRQEAHKTMVRHRMLRGNACMTEAAGGREE